MYQREKWESPWTACSFALKCLQQKLVSLASKVVVVVFFTHSYPLNRSWVFHVNMSVEHNILLPIFRFYFRLYYKVDAVNTNHSNSIFRAKDREQTVQIKRTDTAKWTNTNCTTTKNVKKNKFYVEICWISEQKTANTVLKWPLTKNHWRIFWRNKECASPWGI